MKIIETKNYMELSKKASEILIKEIVKKPKAAFGLATGNTQIGMYKNLVKAYKEGKVDFSGITTFNLDEYYPIKKSDKKSFYYYMHHNFFSSVNVKESNINLLNGEAKDPKKECGRYERKIKKNPIYLQMLGLGVDGHIGFNEPGSRLNSKTRLVKLAEVTVKTKKSPEMALTMGINTIMKAKKTVLLASGKSKAKAVKCLVNSKISSTCPASVLRKHKDFTLIIDKAAGILL